jgi:uncharacterized protein YutE (UPF0331/DUF86 family)
MSEIIEFYLNLVENKLNVLEKYKKKLSNIYSVPLKEEYFENDDLILEELLDAIVYKFNKIQSIISEKLFKLILEYVGINAKEKNFIEILSILDKEGILEIEKWRKLREIRNKITHDYPDELEEIVNGINELLENINYLKKVFEKLKNYKVRFDEIK